MRVVVSLVFVAASSAAAAAASPPHPMNNDLIRSFGGQFRCPYAQDWLTKGPEKAAVDLGLMMTAPSGSGKNNATTTTMARLLSTMGHPGAHSLRRAQDEIVAGSCVYTNPWTGAPSCVELRGSAWTEETMQYKCNDLTEATMAPQTPCTRPASLAGWCWVENENSADGTLRMMEAHPLPLSDDDGISSSCNSMRSTCETMIRGNFEPAESCVGAAASPVDDEDDNANDNAAAAPVGNSGGGGGAGGGPPPAAGLSEETTKCSIAPGPIGAAHQAGYASGYSNSCPGTPAEGSPYMWPTAWSAHVESKSMPFRTDEVIYHARGMVWYRLDKNWKRSDNTYQRGIQRHVGQGPCPEEDVVTGDESGGAIKACRRNSDRRSTMIHRGAKMVFISWKNDTADYNDASNIEQCKWLDLQVVGNVRPDWFMDDRGDSTDVQYLGNQHVFYRNEPRLVKQWRKKDFANQYFVMSVLENKLEDNINWPMILNVPGEGFGDDFLQIYTNQSLLTDEDDHVFLLDEALEAMGGSCPQMDRYGDKEGGDSGTDGPPTGKAAHIPSNLEVDPNSWYSNVYTFSPVWEPPAKDGDNKGNKATAASSLAITQVGDDVTVTSCYDPDVGAVRFGVKFSNIEKSGDGQLPWMALGYRETEECLMTPRGGGDSRIILISSSASDDSTALPTATYGPLSPSLKQFGGEQQSPAEYFASSHVALEDAEGFFNAELVLPDPTSSSSLPIAAASDGVEGEYDESTVELHFYQSMESVPEQMYLMYAMGNSPQVGYHATRVCFEVSEFPTCVNNNAHQQSGAVAPRTLTAVAVVAVIGMLFSALL